MNDIEKRIDKMIKKSKVILNAGKQTNEEWFCSLSTVEKAMWLFRKCNYASVFGSPTSREFYEWLKEIRTVSQVPLVLQNTEKVG